HGGISGIREIDGRLAGDIFFAEIFTVTIPSQTAFCDQVHRYPKSRIHAYATSVRSRCRLPPPHAEISRLYALRPNRFLSAERTFHFPGRYGRRHGDWEGIWGIDRRGDFLVRENDGDPGGINRENTRG